MSIMGPVVFSTTQDPLIHSATVNGHKLEMSYVARYFLEHNVPESHRENILKTAWVLSQLTNQDLILSAHILDATESLGLETT